MNTSLLPHPFNTARTPAIVAVVDRILPDNILAALASRGADILEIRFDLLDSSFEAALEYARHVRSVSGLPLLGTLRETAANGADRTDRFKAIIPLVDMIDIEIDTPVRDAVIALVNQQKKTVIVSEHDYNGMPDTARLEAIVSESLAAGAHIVKIAALAQNRSDAARLMVFTKAQSAPVITIAMGAHGSLTRIAAPLFGSLATYVSIGGDVVAPGQIPLDTVANHLAAFFPERT